jgi:hypothetical protein
MKKKAHIAFFFVKNDQFFLKKRTPANGSSYKIPDGDCFTPTGFAMTTPFQLRAKKRTLANTRDPIKSRLRLLHPYGVRNDNAFSVTSEKKRTPANGSSYKIPDGDCFTPTGLAMTMHFQLRARKKRISTFIEIPKIKICSEASETRRRDRSCIRHTARVPTTKYSRRLWANFTCP